MSEKLKVGEADWIDGDKYSQRVGKLTSEALLENITSDVIPNGTMYFNIGNQILTPVLQQDHQMISDYCTEMQEVMNKAAGISIKGQRTPFNQDRAKGIVDLLSSQPFKEVKWILKKPLETCCDSVRADHMEANAKFHAKARLTPKIIRKTDGKCCEWCNQLASEYKYPSETPHDVFRKHENCGCTVEYDPVDGSRRRQDVWKKKWSKPSGDGSQQISLNQHKKG